ncbi:MAG: prepilin-type N-terminal cleavage/methylation domain-containing protein, partial [Candidatus Riflebacteria bacterium]|nr:prepilin-type N-terminal cleavage/methylation domain-containing protein [Candidatus Riflebacteria bacterium]
MRKTILIQYSKKAFTLVEIMVAILMTTIVLTAAYTIWSRIQRGIAISNTKQILQSELRNVANFMQNDFKSIKMDDTNTIEVKEDNSGNFTISFKKFAETEDGKLAQDSVEDIKYTLNNSMLSRQSSLGKKILSLNCEGVTIQNAVEDINLQGGNNVSLETLNESFKDGRKAKLEITITGKKRIPGSNEDMYHVEKTSVVMREEYSKNINKTFISNFDLQKKESDKIIVAGDASNFGDGSLSYEYLITLNDEALKAVEDTQKELKSNTEQRMDDCNKQIKDTSTGQGALGKALDWLCFWSDSDEEKVDDWRDDLAKAETKSGVEKVKKEMVDWKGDKDEKFLDKSTDNDKCPKKYSDMSKEEQEIYQLAYDMKVQDRVAKKAYDKQCENLEDGEEAPSEPELSIDRYQNGTKGNQTDVKDDKGNVVDLSSSSKSQEDSAKVEKVVAAYNNINLDWMDEGGNEQELNTYSACKTLISYADTKVDIIDMLDKYKSNLNN